VRQINGSKLKFIANLSINEYLIYSFDKILVTGYTVTHLNDEWVRLECPLPIKARSLIFSAVNPAISSKFVVVNGCQTIPSEQSTKLYIDIRIDGSVEDSKFEFPHILELFTYIV
jgi:hypothetical protein